MAAKATTRLALALLIQQTVGRRRSLIGSAVGHACLVRLLRLPFLAVAFPPLSIACLRSQSRAEARVMASLDEPEEQPNDARPAARLGRIAARNLNDKQTAEAVAAALERK